MKKDERECFNCKITQSPVWRSGPNSTTLCNACGLTYRHKGVLRSVEKLRAKPVGRNAKRLRLESYMAEKNVTQEQPPAPKRPCLEVPDHPAQAQVQFTQHQLIMLAVELLQLPVLEEPKLDPGPMYESLTLENLYSIVMGLVSAGS